MRVGAGLTRTEFTFLSWAGSAGRTGKALSHSITIYLGGGLWFCCFFFPNSPRTCSTGFGCCCCVVVVLPVGFFGPPSRFCSVPAIEGGLFRLGTSLLASFAPVAEDQVRTWALEKCPGNEGRNDKLSLIVGECGFQESAHVLSSTRWLDACESTAVTRMFSASLARSAVPPLQRFPMSR